MTLQSTTPARLLPIHNNLLSALLFTLLCGPITTPCTSQVLSGYEPPITDLTFAPNGNSVVCCSQKGLHILGWPNLNVIKHLDVSLANLHCITYSPTGNNLAIGGGYPSQEGIVQVFSWPDCKLQSHLAGHDDSVVALTWQEGGHLTSASLDRVLKTWDLTTQKPVISFQGHSRAVKAVCTLSTGQLVTAGDDHSVRLWDSESGSLIRTLNQHTKTINSISACPSRHSKPMIATAAGDRTIRFWQPTIGRMMRYIRLESEPLDICWLSETTIAASCVDGQVRIVDTENVRLLNTIPVIHGWAYAIATHPSDGTIAVAGSNGEIRRVQIEN